MKDSGQALISLIMISGISLIILTGAILVAVIAAQSSLTTRQSTQSRVSAESGIENAAIRLLRNPAYAGEILNIDSNTVTINIAANKIDSQGKVGSVIKRIESDFQLNNSILRILSWKDRP